MRLLLKNGGFALVDKRDLPRLKTRVWYRVKGYRTEYAKSHAPYPPVLMHRFLVGKPGLIVDHINGNGLDNRKANLELCSWSENRVRGKELGPRKKRQGTISRFRGVTYSKRDGHWIAKTTEHGHIGVFKTELQATKAVKEREAGSINARRQLARMGGKGRQA